MTFALAGFEGLVWRTKAGSHIWLVLRRLDVFQAYPTDGVSVISRPKPHLGRVWPVNDFTAVTPPLPSEPVSPRRRVRGASSCAWTPSCSQLSGKAAIFIHSADGMHRIDIQISLLSFYFAGSRKKMSVIPQRVKKLTNEVFLTLDHKLLFTPKRSRPIAGKA